MTCNLKFYNKRSEIIHYYYYYIVIIILLLLLSEIKQI